MKTRLVSRPNGVLLIGVLAMLVALPVCGGSSDEPTPVATAVQTAPTAIPTVAPTEVPEDTPTPAPTAATAPAPTSAAPTSDGSADADLLAQGKIIFEETAGGVGCAWCHGMDGKGAGPSGLGAPKNRGATRDMFEDALAGGETEAMTFIELTEAEKVAVLAYLQFLETQE